jgi:hypothetical protein
MLAAPLLGFVAVAVAPEERTNAAEQLALVADSPARLGIGVLLSLVSLALLVVAVLGLVDVLGRAETAYGSTGGVLALFGIVAAAALTGMHWIDYHLAKVPERDVAVDLESRITSGAAFALLSAVALATSVGLLVLAAGLLRRGAVGSWAPVAISAGAVLVPVGHLAAEGSAGKGLQLAGYAAFVAGLGAVGLFVVRGVAEHPRT